MAACTRKTCEAAQLGPTRRAHDFGALLCRERLARARVCLVRSSLLPARPAPREACWSDTHCRGFKASTARAALSRTTSATAATSSALSQACREVGGSRRSYAPLRNKRKPQPAANNLSATWKDAPTAGCAPNAQRQSPGHDLAASNTQPFGTSKTHLTSHGTRTVSYTHLTLPTICSV